MSKLRFLFIVLCVAACRPQPNTSRDNDKFDPAKMFRLQLNPVAGSSYNYDITNESETTLELNDKKTEAENKATTGIIFSINKDSSGDFLFNMKYNKIHLYIKNGETETDADAGNAATSIDPTEKALGMIKDARLVATISPAGETKNITGYQELGDKIIAGFATDDINGKTIANNLWNKKIGNGLVKGTIDQLFKIFPDSAVHLHDNWRLTSKQQGEISLIVKNSYTLKAINNDIAVISIEGTITSDNTGNNVMGMGDVTTDLKGGQEGEFEMETKTGMLISCRMKGKAEGTIHVMGKDIPVVVKSSVKIDGHKL